MWGLSLSPEMSVIFNQLTMADRPRRSLSMELFKNYSEIDGCLHDIGKPLSNNRRTI
jgi:hypothetical protein